MEEEIIPILEGILTIVSSSINTAFEESDVNETDISLSSPIVQEGGLGPLFLYGKEENITRYENDQMPNITGDFLLLTAEKNYDKTRSGSTIKYSHRESYMIEMYFEEFIFKWLNKGGSIVVPYAHFANHGLTSLTKDIMKRLTEEEWQTSFYTVIPKGYSLSLYPKRAPVAGFSHYDVLKSEFHLDNYVASSSHMIHNNLGDIYGMTISLSVDIIDERNYEIGGKEYLRGERDFQSRAK